MIYSVFQTSSFSQGTKYFEIKRLFTFVFKGLITLLYSLFTAMLPETELRSNTYQLCKSVSYFIGSTTLVPHLCL